MMFDFNDAVKKDKQFINETWDKLNSKLSVIAQRSQNKIPYTTSDGVHDDRSATSISAWTNGFWPGLMWLMYYGTKNDTYRKTAEISEVKLDEALKNFDSLHHDVGFMWQPSAVANYRITGNEQSRSRALYAASILASRYNTQGNFIRAWNDWGNPKNKGSAIIDCMINIPLLYWASNETNDPRFKHIAINHADTTMKNHIRSDGSVKHIVYYDPDTGEYLENVAGQGYSKDSSWSRGQAWAIYGFALSYIHTQKQEYLDTAKIVANYFIANVCDTYIPLSDFRAPEEPVIYDSTAGAVAACGLIEIARNVSAYEGKIYYRAAINLLKALDEKCCNYSLTEDSILQMGTEYWNEEGEGGKGVHIPIIYGDYYFTEAIYKLKGFELLFE